MAHVNNSLVTGKLSGLLGKELVFRDWDGKTVVAKAPKPRKGEPKPGQLARQEKFFLATRYAKALLASTDQSMIQAYARLLRPRQNVFSRAIEDFMSPPKVKNIDARRYHGAIGDSITIRAIDDFRVTAVLVEIYAPNGTRIESSAAVQNANGIDWTYTNMLPNTTLVGSKIKAIAVDVPGNEGTLEITL
jgi:hypothetical protein